MLAIVLRNSRSKLLAVLAIAAAVGSASAQSGWTYTFSGMSGTNATASAPGTNPCTVHGACATGSGKTCSGEGPSSVECKYSGTSVFQAVFAVVQVSSGWGGGTGGSADDGYGDAQTGPGDGWKHGYNESGTHWLPVQTANLTDFTLTIPQASATAPPGTDNGGYCDQINISVTLTLYPVSMSYTGVITVGSNANQIVIGQPFTATLNIPSGLSNSGDTFTWTSPAAGDGADPYTSYSASYASSSYTAFQEPATTSDTLSCNFGLLPFDKLPQSATEQPMCAYRSALANEAATVTGPTVTVWTPGQQADPKGWVTTAFGAMTLVTNPASDPSPTTTNPEAFQLYGAVSTQLTAKPGIFQGEELLDPTGFSGGQFALVQILTLNADTWTDKDQDTTAGIDSGYPYPFGKDDPNSKIAFPWCGSGYELLMDDIPNLYWGSWPSPSPLPNPYNGTKAMDFSDWLVYVPTGGSTDAPVPIPLSTWTAGGTCAADSNGAWTSSDSSTGPGTKPSPQFVVWTTEFNGNNSGGGGDTAGAGIKARTIRTTKPISKRGAHAPAHRRRRHRRHAKK